MNYLDIPLWDRDILKKMGRNQNPDQIYKLIQKIREEIPDIAIRSTFIVGFPGESEKQFNNLLDFLVRAELDWVGAFKYSQEDGTLAACFPNQVSEEVKEERYHILMSLQRNITNKKNKRWIGRIAVLVEGKEEEEAFLGRIEQQARDVDGVVILKPQTL